MLNEKIKLLDLLYVIAKGKKSILIITLLFSIGAVVFSILVTQKWQSTAIVQPILSSTGLDLSNIGGSILSGLSSSLGMNSTEVEGKRLVAIAYSRPFLEKLIKEFKLDTYFKTNKDRKSKPEEIRDNTLKEIKSKLLFVTFDEKVGFLNVSVITKDKYLSSIIANYVVKELDCYNQNERMTKAKEKRILLENRIKSINTEIESCLSDLATFQQNTRILSVEDQVSSLMENYIKLESERVSKQIALDLLLINFDKNDLRVQSKKDEVNVIRDYIRKLENSDDYSKYIVSLDKLPAYAKEYIQIESRLLINRTVLEYIYPQLEIAKLEEMRESTTFDIIEDAVPAGRRAWPKRALLCISVFVLSFIFSIGYVLIKDYIKRQISINDNKEKIENIIKILLNKK